MFIVRRSQIDAFRLPMREVVRGQAKASLQEEEGVEAHELPDGRSLAWRDRRGNQTTLTYSERILPEAITKPLGQRYGLTYDNEGRLSQLHYPGGEQVQLGYKDRLLSRLQTSPTSTFEFDYMLGRLSRVGYPGGRSEHFLYDGLGNLSKHVDQLGYMRQYERDPSGQLQAIVDPLGRSVLFEYEEHQFSGLVFPDQSRQTFAYDEDEDALFMTLRDGKSFAQRLQGDQISELTWEDGPAVRFGYDGQGRPTTIQTSGTRVVFGYTGENLSQEVGPAGTTRLTHDEDGFLEQLTLPSGLVIGYDYNANDQLAAIRIGEQTIAYDYGALDLLTAVRYPNGLTEHRQEGHTHGLRQARIVTAGGQTLSEQRYDYDALDRLTTYDNRSSQQVLHLHYDEENRLTGLTDAQTNRPREYFAYDAVGNLTALNGWPVRTGAMNEVRQVGTDTLHYDALGNVSQMRGPRGLMQLRFGRNSTLDELTVGNQTWHYTYDGLGRRVAKTNGHERWQYGWLEGRLISETHYAQPTAPPVVREYVYHPDATTPLAFVEAGRLFIMQADVRGAVTHVFDPQGQVIWQASYSAFGSATLLIDRIRQPFRLAGQQEDLESGLHYNLSRYYAPFLGTYLSLDPEWLNPDTYYYAYARQDPYNRHDPLGNIAPLLVAIGGAALVGGVIGGVSAAMNGGGWRAIAGGVAHGALSAAGATAGAIAGFAVGGPVGAWAGGVAGAGVGGFLGSLADQAIKGDPLCLGCAAESALWDMGIAAALGPLGKLLGKIAGPLLGRLARTGLGRAVVGTFNGAVASVRRGIARLGRKAIPFKPGWSAERVRSIPKGQRPDPRTYLSDDYIDHHLGHFDKEGGAFVLDKAATETSRFTKLPPRKYIMSKPDMDAAMAKYRKSGKVEDLEDALGYSRGDLAGKEGDIYVATAKKDKLKYGMPDGNEIGANPHWEPGGRTSGGKREAVILGPDGEPISIAHDNDINKLSEWFDLEKVNR